MHHSRILATIVLVVLLTPFGSANALPDCDAWLANKVPIGPGKFLVPTPGRLVTVDMNQVTAAGVTIEPSRRMRAKDYPWEHEIQVALPPSYGKTDEPFPVLWVTDGSLLFQLATALATACARQHMPEMIVVGIGSPPDATDQTQMRRNYDFSPTEIAGFSGFGSKAHEEQEHAGAKKRQAEGQPSSYRFGGAPRFLPFIAEEVRESLSRDYRMTKDHTLFGHSGGGLFCAYTLVSQPKAFNRYICGSAALAAGDYEVFRIEERYAQQHKDLPAVAFFGVGEKEVLDKNTLGVFSSTARLPEVLKTRGYASLKLTFRSFEGESHVSVIPPLLAEGLRSVWAGDFGSN
jgi:predicted alpha/beta superfamily hydrolase